MQKNNQTFICPKCNKEGAKFSYYYSNLIVHKCDGVTLDEINLEQIKLEKREADIHEWDKWDNYTMD